jgi:assimilatory nitrate reductase catalytic subunit
VKRILGQLFYAKSGPLTRELELVRGSHGARLPERLHGDATAQLICGFCSTGCALHVHLREGAPVTLTPATAYPVNRGMACPKGWEGLEPLRARDRAVTPLLRDGNGRLQPIDWPGALAVFVDRFKAILSAHGPESVAFLSTGQIVSEEMALLGALAKFGMGIVDGDGNTRQCMATAVTAYKQSFGFDAPPYTYRDFEESDVVVLVGSNLCVAHPILWERLCRSRRSPRILVIDPRKTETAMAATQHFAIRPKSDLTLFTGLAQLMIERGWLDPAFIAAHVSGFEELKAHARAFTVERVRAASGLGDGELEELATAIGRGGRVSFWWTMGVNQSHEGVRVAQSIINLALITGNIGKPGTGANSITGQCNAMGSRLFSNTTNLLGGHDFADAAQREKVARVLELPVDRIPARASRAYDEIVDGIASGRVRGLWIIGTNPAHSWIHQGSLHQLLGKLDFLVVQDMYRSTETAARAHLVLPAAGWGEKEGTFINSERRVGVIRPVARAPGQALSDFRIFRLIAEAWGCAELFRRWRSPEEVFGLMQQLSAGQPCDISGIGGYDMLESSGGVQWPFPAGATVEERERRLFAHGRFFHGHGPAPLIFQAPRELPEPTSDEYPLLLLTGRGSSSQWHTQTRTAKSAVLARLAPRELYVEVNPVDARRLGLDPATPVEVRSRRGAVRARLFVTHSVRAGEVFMPMHYAETNQLTLAAFDPYSRQPAYKACAVAIQPLGHNLNKS